MITYLLIGAAVTTFLNWRLGPPGHWTNHIIFCLFWLPLLLWCIIWALKETFKGPCNMS